MSLRISIAGIVLFGVAIACGGCSGASTAGPRLYSPINGSLGLGMPGFVPNRVYSTGEVPLCIDRPGLATITGVRPVRPTNGFEVVGFAVKPFVNNEVGAAPGDLAALGWSRSEMANKSVTWVCSAQQRANVGLSATGSADSAGWVELGITFTGSNPGATKSQALSIDYLSGGESHTATAAFSLTLCPGRPIDEC